MQIKHLLKLLESQPLDKVCKYGFGEPHAHRGYYNHVSFPPNASDITIGQMLEYVNEATEHPFEGWKGGKYSYDLETPVHFNYEGVCSMDDEDCNLPNFILESILS